MPAQALYLKYRPQTFEDVIGQGHITKTLKNALAMGRISHAYLFTGTRGTGKTSTARILAKAVNCLSERPEKPCNECAICRAINQERLLDLIEIDAASNTGVDNIRELREKVDLRPSEARYKVYIIDESHMLSNAAFNALLKTLEEPPPHVIFVLATTEANRLPATIISRCQRFDFRRATVAELVQQLQRIARAEGLTIEPAALELIARQANGSFRDATSLLDQLTAYRGDTITLEHVQLLLGAASHEIIHEIVAGIAARNVGRGIAAVGHAVDAGADPRQLARDLVEYLRGILLLTVKSDATDTLSRKMPILPGVREGASQTDVRDGVSTLNLGQETLAEMRALAAQMTTAEVMRAIRLLLQAAHDLRSSTNPTLPLEMALVEAALEPVVPQTPPPAIPRHAAPVPPPLQPDTTAKMPRPTSSKKKSDTPDPVVPPASIASDFSLETIRQHWEKVISRFQSANRSAAAFLRSAEPISLQDGTLTIGFFYELHQTRFGNEKNIKQLEQVLSELFGVPCRIRCALSPKKVKMQAAEDDPVIRAAMNLGARIVNLQDTVAGSHAEYSQVGDPSLQPSDEDPPEES